MTYNISVGNLNNQQLIIFYDSRRYIYNRYISFVN
jgi:hypothetical protein